MDEFLAFHDYYDLFIVGPDGTVLYTYFKEDDFGGNVLEGPLAESGLGIAVRTALGLGPGQVAVSRFMPYAPSDGEWAAFVAGAVEMPDGDLGALAFQVAPARLGARLESIRGRRGTAVSTLVGPNLTVLPAAPWAMDTPTDPESLEQQVLTRVGAGAPTGADVLTDPEGTRWVMAWEVVGRGQEGFIAVVRADAAAVRAMVAREQRAIVLAGFLLWGAAAALTLGVRRGSGMARHEI